MMRLYTNTYNFLGILAILYSTANAIMYQIVRKRRYLLNVAVSQALFAVEIFNIFVGASRSTYLPTIVQLASRNFIIWVVVYLHGLHGLLLTVMLVCWNISDFIRYVFYLFRANLFKKLRYNAFIVLYPVGISLEIYLTNRVYLMYKGVRSWFFGAIMLLYLPLFPYLYYHMIKQRKRSNKIFEVNKKKRA